MKCRKCGEEMNTSYHYGHGGYCIHGECPECGNQKNCVYNYPDDERVGLILENEWTWYTGKMSVGEW